MNSHENQGELENPQHKPDGYNHGPRCLRPSYKQSRQSRYNKAPRTIEVWWHFFETYFYRNKVKAPNGSHQDGHTDMMERH